MQDPWCTLLPLGRKYFALREMHVRGCTLSAVTLQNFMLHGSINRLCLPVLLHSYLFMFTLCCYINPIIKEDLCTKSSNVLQALNGEN